MDAGLLLFSGNLAEQKELIAFQQELLVPAGQRAELTLPDGTKVWLNAGSKLSYPSFFEKERKVFLSGEGFLMWLKTKKYLLLFLPERSM